MTLPEPGSRSDRADLEARARSGLTEDAAHATLQLREPDGEASGRADDTERALAAQSARRGQFFARIAECTGRPQQVVEESWRGARYLEPADAMALGYADDVA